MALQAEQQPPRTLSVLYFPFSETTPSRTAFAEYHTSPPEGGRIHPPALSGAASPLGGPTAPEGRERPPPASAAPLALWAGRTPARGRLPLPSARLNGWGEVAPRPAASACAGLGVVATPPAGGYMGLRPIPAAPASPCFLIGSQPAGWRPGTARRP